MVEAPAGSEHAAVPSRCGGRGKVIGDSLVPGLSADRHKNLRNLESKVIIILLCLAAMNCRKAHAGDFYLWIASLAVKPADKSGVRD